MKNNTVLLVSIAFSPNVGGIETHFDDLVDYLDNHNWNVTVLTYTPITTDVKAKLFERKGIGVTIFRIPWFRGVFYKLIKSPALEFLFLLPGLFFVLPFLLLTKARKIQVIHSHGLVAGFVSVFWGKLFRKRVITTTHSIYHFPKAGWYRKFATWIFNQSNEVLTLSKQSKSEIEELGIPGKKVTVFTYWVNQEVFKPIPEAKKKVGWEGKFFVLFVGRLIEEKGVKQLLTSFKKWDSSISLAIAGVGPLQEEIERVQRQHKNLEYLGNLSQDKLPLYYSAADVLIVPSIHEEGFGRVIIEALSCGTPVIAANRGGIVEAVDTTVSILIEINEETITKTIQSLYKDKQFLQEQSKRAQSFAKKKFSLENGRIIIEAYKV